MDQQIPHDDTPGTILLYDAASSTGNRQTHNGDIILQPKPSSDPEDPLNWTAKRKYLAIGMVYLYTFAIGIATSVHASILTQISASQNLSFAQLNTGTGLMQLMQGWGCLLWQPFAMTYGRRGVYITTAMLSIAPVIWTPLSFGASQWYAHRILLGIFCSPVESLPEVSVPDIFFAHERGRYMALYTFILFGSNFLAPFFSGFIADGAGWRWVMYFATIVLGVCSIILFLFTEETIFFRNTIEGLDPISSDENSTEIVKKDARNDLDTKRPPILDQVQDSIPMREKRTFLQKLSLVTRLPGRPSRKQTILKTWRSLKIIALFPNILWAGLLYGTNIAWYSVINATMSMILGEAPYSFSPTLVGVAYLSPLVFGGVAAVWAGKFSDVLTMRLARRNDGIREPEHRLWGLAVSAVMSSGGLLIWGVGASRNAHFMVLIVGIGITTFGVVCASAISLSYAVDCFKEIAGESFVAIIIIRNTLAFAFSYAITPWIEASGLQNCFISVAMISLVCTCSFLPMIKWGKALRRFSAERYWRFVADERETAVH
ncbi:hypothetical protein COL5a_003395 [Colletotrichum fioriniae]|nr:uncharacterized protein COL516b_000623 [Colletotrichum fioriniae]KAJ0313682.1 hypothetical protein COL516b_000623 [Colletotrichum fioriniae]KAJ0330333.1 hypothetical protein COL5a_003395 [Colletotrichum fioriniae]